jgi:hypothetical protein
VASVLKKVGSFLAITKRAPPGMAGRVVTAYYEKLTRYTMVAYHTGPFTKMMAVCEAESSLMING